MSHTVDLDDDELLARKLTSAVTITDGLTDTAAAKAPTAPMTTITQPTPSDSLAPRLPSPAVAGSSTLPSSSTLDVAPASTSTPPTPTSPSLAPPMSPLASQLSSGNSPGGGSGIGTPRRPVSALVQSAFPPGSPGTPKPRSNSSLQSSRPAPPSPANSRPASQILSSPGHSPHHSPHPSQFGLSSPVPSGQASPTTRDRAGSASSLSTMGRRVRPRSTLGTTSLVPSSHDASLTIVSEPTTPRTTDEPLPETLDQVRESSESARQTSVDEETPAAASVSAAPGAASTTSSLLLLAATMVRRVVVRDYAYPCDDERFLGLGPTRPRSNWCEGEPEPEDPPERAKSEAAGGWGLSLGGLGWGLLRKSEEPTTGGDDQDWVGTPDHDADSYWSDEDDADGEGENGDTTPDGLYRAAYAFEPEGVNEMAIDVGDLLDVRGRGGGGDGWVVAVRLDNDKEGLVPEGYLEFVDEDECPEGWAHLRKQRTDAEERERIRAREGQSEEDLLIETRVERG